MSFYPEYIVALSIGFIGSLHCLGMCGPIALIVPSKGRGFTGRLIGGFIYNLGRIITYASLGLLAGAVGKGIAFFSWQQGLSISLGVLIVLFNTIPSVFKRFSVSPLSLKFTNWIKDKLGSFLNRKSGAGILLIGILNGLLPCGLVYMGLAGSLEMGQMYSGSVFMIFFGLGTLPMMTGIHLLGNNLKGGLKNKISKAIPYFAVIIGLLFILRGLGLGIPYLSPSMDPHTGDIHCTSPAHRHMPTE